MSKLFEALSSTSTEEKYWGFIQRINSCLVSGTWSHHYAYDYYKHFNFKDVSRVGNLVIGLCTWSSTGKHFPSDAVVYIGHRQNVETSAGTLVSKIIIKETWDVNCNNDSDLWETYNILTPLRKQKWWHRRKYQASQERVRIEGKHTLESALLLARMRAENIFGITSEIETRLQQVIQDLKYRDRAFEELNVHTASV